jgi:hypothetical protein
VRCSNSVFSVFKESIIISATKSVLLPFAPSEALPRTVPFEIVPLSGRISYEH